MRAAARHRLYQPFSAAPVADSRIITVTQTLRAHPNGATVELSDAALDA
jgi:hypothetical protein